MTGTRQAQRSEERREYFRIDDDVFLRYRVLEDDSLDAARERFEQRERRHSITGELNRITRRLDSHIKSVKLANAELARCLEVMNDKIDLLVQYTLIQDPDAEARPNRHVSISAGGMAFCCDDELQPGDYLEMSFKLFPSYREIDAIAEVVSTQCTDQHCNPENHGLALRFIVIEEHDRDALQEHVLKRELQRRRAGRH